MLSCCFGACQVRDGSTAAAEKEAPRTAAVPVAPTPKASRAHLHMSRDQLSDSAKTRKLTLKALTTPCKPDQGLSALASPQPLAQSHLCDLQPLMATNINRQYTDYDWFAAIAAISQAQQLLQQRALQQLPTMRSTNPSCNDNVADGDDDDVDAWFSPRSHTISTASTAFITDTERDEVSKLAQEMEQHDQQQQQLTLSLTRELEMFTSKCVPNPPLLFADKNWRYCQVDVKPFCFFWERDNLRSTPSPLPIDEQMKLNPLGHKVHQSITGTWFREVGQQVLMHVNPSLPGIPGAITKYTEYYNKDQSPNSWAMRRDIRVGKTVGQMFMTTDGLLILRVCTYGLFSKNVEWINEDYLRLEDNGETVVTRQVCKVMADDSVQSQFLIGRKAGTAPLKH